MVKKKIVNFLIGYTKVHTFVNNTNFYQLQNSQLTVTKMTLGEKTKTFRAAKGYSQENMAKLLNISSTAYAKIERGETDVNFSRLEQIAKAFEVKV